MKYHIVGRSETAGTCGMHIYNDPLVKIGWATAKCLATEFDRDDAERLIGALEYLADVKDLTLKPAKETWILVSQQTMYLGMYVSASSAVTGIKWARVKDNAKEFDSQKEAEDYSQALITLFDLYTTPEKLS